MGIEKLFEQPEHSKMGKQLGENTVKVSELRLKYPDNSTHNLLYYKANIMMEDSRIGLAGIFTDITHIREVEVALRESEEKLIQANLTKDRFFSLIAHDLKNPFHAIMGLSHLLKTKYSLISDKDRENIATTIYHSAENTFQLLINLLDWARLQEGKIQVKPEGLKVLPIVEECLFLLKPKIDEKMVSATFDIDQVLSVFADKNMVLAIFRNLIGNSVKFTEAGGSIHISARTVNKNIEISVADTGIGISKNDLKYLFRLDKMRQAQGTDEMQGTGLGLILCKDFVEMNQGRIWAESVIGKGSIFYFTLPQSSVHTNSNDSPKLT